MRTWLSPYAWVLVYATFVQYRDYPIPEFPQAHYLRGEPTAGGTGKTPMTEYLVELLLQKENAPWYFARLRQKSKGFHYVEPHKAGAHLLWGDEPSRLNTAFPAL